MAEITLGISLDYPERWEQLPPEWPLCALDGVDFVELPGNGFPLNEIWNESLQAWDTNYVVRDLMPGWFIRHAVETSGGIFVEFKERFRERIRMAAKAGATAVAADFDLTATARNEEYRTAITEMLAGFFQPLEEYRIDLLLSLRLPAAQAGTTGGALSTFAKRHHPRFKLAIDIFLHESAGHEAELLKIVEEWKYSIGALRFHYEPELGNRLIAKHMIDFIRPFLHRGLPVMVSAAPVCVQRSSLNPELHQLQRLFEETRNLMKSQVTKEEKEEFLC